MDDLRYHGGAVVFHVVAKVRLGGVRAGDQHPGDSGKCIGHLGEEFVLGAHLAAMLARVVHVLLDAGCLNLCVVVVDQGDSVIHGHEQILGERWLSASRGRQAVSVRWRT